MAKAAWRGLIAILSWGIVSAVASPPSFAQEATARLTFFSGQVTVKGPGLAPQIPAVLGQAFNQGDMVQTGVESRAEITLPEKRGILRVAGQSMMMLVSMGETDSTRKTETQLRVGSVWINFKALGNIKRLEERRSDFYMSSPTAVTGVRGTVYRMEVDPDSTSRVRVYEGQVQVGWAPQQAFIPGQTILQAPTEVAGPQEITMTQWVELIRAGQQAVLTPDRKAAISPFDAAKDAQDEWVRWNQARDEKE